MAVINAMAELTKNGASSIPCCFVKARPCRVSVLLFRSKPAFFLFLFLFIQALGMKPCLDQALFLALVVVLLIYDIVVLLLLVLVGLMRPNLSVFTSSDQFLD